MEEKPWLPAQRMKDDQIVPVRVGYTEKDLRDKLKAMGGKWSPAEKVWRVSVGHIRGTELEERILAEDGIRKRER